MSTPATYWITVAIGTMICVSLCLACASGDGVFAEPGTHLGARVPPDRRTSRVDEGHLAIQHSILIAIWHMGTTGTLYDDPGADFFTRLHPERAKNRALHQLEAMGYRVTLGRTG